MTAILSGFSAHHPVIASTTIVLLSVLVIAALLAVAVHAGRNGTEDSRRAVALMRAAEMQDPRAAVGILASHRERIPEINLALGCVGVTEPMYEMLAEGILPRYGIDLAILPQGDATLDEHMPTGTGLVVTWAQGDLRTDKWRRLAEMIKHLADHPITVIDPAPAT